MDRPTYVIGMNGQNYIPSAQNPVQFYQPQQLPQLSLLLHPQAVATPPLPSQTAGLDLAWLGPLKAYSQAL